MNWEDITNYNGTVDFSSSSYYPYPFGLSHDVDATNVKMNPFDHLTVEFYGITSVNGTSMIGTVYIVLWESPGSRNEGILEFSSSGSLNYINN
jgi:hypothetical protein